MPEDKTPPAGKADDATEKQLAAVLSDDPESNEEAFAAAFDEFAATDDTTTTAEALPAEGLEDDKAGAAVVAPATDSADDKAASGDAPSDADAKDPPAEAAPDGAAEKDIWADATPEQKAAFEAAQHENKSHKNRASAQNRKINQLMSAPKPAAQPAAEQPATPETAENWEQFKTEYPEVAGPLAERMDRQDKEMAALRSENANLLGQVTGISDARTQDSINAEEAVLAQRHPDWEQFTASAEFIAWLPNQPRYVQEGLARNGAAIVDGEEAASLLDLFRDDHAAPETPETPETPKPAETPATDTTTTNGKATRRERRLESAVSTESGQAGPGAGPPEGDFDTAFDHFAKQP